MEITKLLCEYPLYDYEVGFKVKEIKISFRKAIATVAVASFIAQYFQ